MTVHEILQFLTWCTVVNITGTGFCNDVTGTAYDKNMRLNIYGENHVTKKNTIILVSIPAMLPI